MLHIIEFSCKGQAWGEFSTDLRNFQPDIKPSTIRFRCVCTHEPVNGFPCHSVHDLFLEPHKELAAVFALALSHTLSHPRTHTHSPLSLSLSLSVCLYLSHTDGQ